jgi:acyl-coenzyme A synthetase/AMP-(fatty) acid ligase
MKVEAGLQVRMAAERFGPKIALTCEGYEASFAALNARANRLGSGLDRLGISRGARIGVLGFNTPELLVSWFACEKFNFVRVVLHSHFDMEDHVWAMNHVEAEAMIFDARFAETVDRHRSEFSTVKTLIAMGSDVPGWATPLGTVEDGGETADAFLSVDETAPCFLQLTSGTTGRPKPWVKTYRSWQAVIDHNLHHLNDFGPGSTTISPDDVNVHFHPLQWASGFQTLYPYYIRGARSVLVDDEVFEPDGLVDTFVREGATGTFMPGPLLTPVLDTAEGRGGLDHHLQRMVIFFGTPELLERTTRVLGPCWCHGFGSTEQGAVTTRLLPHELEGHPERIESVGRAGSPFFETAIVDRTGRRMPPGELGEIVVRSAMSEGTYWGMPEATRDAYLPDDWFRPSDVGYMDEDGYVYYADRAGDVIQTSGGTVFPHLVETSILSHQAVANCGVVGIGDDPEVVCAVVLKEGHSANEALEGELVALATAPIADLGCAPRVLVVDEVPTVLGGAKVQRQALRERLVQEV